MKKLITTALAEPRVVGDIMTRDPITVNEQDSLATLQEEMQNIVLLASIDAQHKQAVFVADIMTRDVQTARIDTPIAQAAAWIANGRFGFETFDLTKQRSHI